MGETTVTVSAKYGADKTTTSQPMPIQVFLPLNLEPKNVTLIIGAKFQVRVLGGPQAGVLLTRPKRCFIPRFHILTFFQTRRSSSPWRTARSPRPTTPG